MNFIWALALLIISYTITALTAKKPQTDIVKPATFEDFQFPQHEEGTPQPVIFGDVWIEDWMVLYYGNLSSQAIRTKTAGGKK
jgi:hypothetical protein